MKCSCLSELTKKVCLWTHYNDFIPKDLIVTTVTKLLCPKPSSPHLLQKNQSKMSSNL